MLSEICDKLSCAPVHHLGKTLILFRQLPGNIKPAALAALEPERPAKRRASEPHTPKSSPPKARRCQAPGAPGRPGRSPGQAGARPGQRAQQERQAHAPEHPQGIRQRPRDSAPRGQRSACAPEPAAAPAAARRPSAESGTSKTIRRSACLRRDCPPGFRLGTAPRRSSPGRSAIQHRGRVGRGTRGNKTGALRARSTISGPHVIADCR